MRSSRILLAAAILLLPLAAQAEDTVKLSRTYKKGDLIRMKTEAMVGVAGMEVKLIQVTKSEVKEIKDNGNVIIEQQLESGKVVLNGMEIDIPEAPKMSITRDKSGKLVEFKSDGDTGLGSPELAQLMAVVGEPQIMGKSAKASDSWQTELDNPAVKGKKISIKTTFVGTEKVDGVDAWKVQQSGEAATDDKGMKVTFEATYWLDPANGSELKNETKIKGLPNAMYGPLDVTGKSARVKAEKEK